MRWLLALAMLGFGLTAAAAEPRTARYATCKEAAGHPLEPTMHGRGYEWDKVPDVEMAINACRMALEELPGEPMTLYRLARSLMQLKRYDEAMPLMLRSAQWRYAPAETAYGTAFLNGEGLPQDTEKAALWLKRAVAQGNPMAQNNLAVIYLSDRGRLNDEEGMELLRLAAGQKLALAQANLGFRYRNGKSVKQDLTEAKRLFELSAAQDDPLGQAYLADLLIWGPDELRDIDRAIPLLHASARNGNTSAHWMLGDAYNYGYGVGYDPFAALVHFERAHAGGDRGAAYRIALLYADDRGVGRDDAKTIEYLTIAAKANWPDAMVALGAKYLYGENVERDLDKAEPWLVRAADMQIPMGQRHYAELLLAREKPELVEKAVGYAEAAGYGGAPSAFLILADYFIKQEQWQRAQGYASLALDYGDPSVREGAIWIQERIEPHLKRDFPDGKALS